jgi:ABC-2 type transport system permease protein
MINLLRSEFFKLRTVRLNIWLPFGAVIGLVVVTGLVGLLASDPELFDNEDLMGLIGGFSILVAMMIGVGTSLGITSEFAHNTIRPTLAATPNRPMVFIAKAIVSVAFGLVVSTLAVVLAYAIGSTLLNGRNADVGLSGDDGSLATFFGVIVLGGLLALFGYGLGLLLRNGPAAVSIIILWPLLIESIVGGVLGIAGVDDPQKVLPYSSAFALVIPDSDNAPGGRIYGGVFFGLVALTLAVVGIIVNNRRDV